MENQVMEPKKVFSRIGLALFAMAMTVMVVQVSLVAVISRLWPSFTEGPWFIWVLMGISFYCIGFPVFALMTKGIPDGPKGDRKEISFKDFIVIFFICMAAVYIFNILGGVVNLLIGFIKGEPIMNPLVGALDGANMLGTFIFVGILSPIIEEVVFRGIMIDKLRGYGDKIAIWMSAFTFALFHGNLSQFFYALVLGLFFGYIATKTNTIKYTVKLHIIINIIGSVIMPYLALSENQLLVAAAGFAIIIMVVIGLVLYKQNIGKVKLDTGEIGLNPVIRKRTMYLNLGMILYYIVCLEMFISVIIS